MPIPAPLLIGTHRAFQLSMLWEGSDYIAELQDAERKLFRLVLPPWQRKEVWTVEQKIQFIEGIFLGLGCGYYVVNGADWVDQGGQCIAKPMSRWLIDGQQRITAIRDFLDGKFLIFGDVAWETMSRRDQLTLERTPFECFELDYTSDESVLKELYNRLAFVGTPHTEADRV